MRFNRPKRCRICRRRGRTPRSLRDGAAQPHQSAITALVLGSMMMSRRSPRNSAVMASPRRNACTRRAWEAACAFARSASYRACRATPARAWPGIRRPMRRNRRGATPGRREQARARGWRRTQTCHFLFRVEVVRRRRARVLEPPARPELINNGSPKLDMTRRDAGHSLDSTK